MREKRGVAVGDADDLVVGALLVGHVEDADGTRADPAAREGGIADEDERVERVAVLAERALDVAVVGGVAHRGEQPPVEHDPAELTIPLVLVARPARDLHEDDDLRRGHGASVATCSSSTVTRAPSRRSRRTSPPSSGDGLVAEVFLGYGLSAGLRRRDTPGPPEPCPLPLLACRVRPAREERPAAGARSRSASGSERGRDDDYEEAVEAVRDAIARGDVYQVNLVQHLSARFRGDRRPAWPPRSPRSAPRRRGALRGRRLGGRVGVAGALPRARGDGASGRVRSRGRSAAAAATSSPSRRRTRRST